MKPILFNTEMVRTILDGRKTQTRRVVKNKGKNRINENGSYSYINKKDNTFNGGTSSNIPQIMVDILSPYQIDDILYVRETFVIGVPDGTMPESDTNPITVFYKADNSVHGWMDENEDECNVPWKPSIHMPKEYARIFLKVTNIKVERLQDISDEDCEKEGCSPSTYGDAKDWLYYENGWHRTFRQLWNSTAKDGYKWEDNPYVFVYEFERIEKPC